MILEYKVEIWKTIQISDDASEEEIIKLLEHYKDKDISDIWNHNELYDYVEDSDHNLETEKYIKPISSVTAELMDNDRNVIWSNGY